MTILLYENKSLFAIGPHLPSRPMGFENRLNLTSIHFTSPFSPTETPPTSQTYKNRENLLIVSAV